MRSSMISFLTFLVLIAGFSFCGCKTQKQDQNALSDLPSVQPAELIRFDAAGDIFFSHLAYHSVVLEDGDIVLGDRELKLLLKISAQGELQERVLEPGRGPGEVQDINFISRGRSGEIFVHDQINKKVIRLDKNGVYLDELSVPPWESANLTEIYELEKDLYLMAFKSFDYLMNPEKEPRLHLAVYNGAEETFVRDQTLDDRPFARQIVDGAVRGGSIVPYAPEHLRAFESATGTLTLFYSGGDRLAKINAGFDTLSVVELPVEPEGVSEGEIAEFREDSRAEVWREMKSLLPEDKALAEDMLIDGSGNHWLKLNHRSDHDQWLVIDAEGKPLTLVNLPEGSMLTHVSKNHLGVRLDEVTFALFEAVF